MNPNTEWKLDLVATVNSGAEPSEAQLNEQILETVQSLSHSPVPVGRDELLRKLSPKRKFNPTLALAYAVIFIGITVVVQPVFYQAKAASKKQMDRSIEGAASAQAPMAELSKDPSSEDAAFRNTVKAAVPSTKTWRTDANVERSSQWNQGASPSQSLPYTASNLPPLVASKVIRTAEVKVETDDVAKSQRQILLEVRGEGGFAEVGSFSNEDGNAPRATMQLRVPEAKFDQILDRIQAMGKVLQLTNTGKDVSLEVASGDASLKTLRVQEEELRLMLLKARSTTEIFQIKNRVNEIRRQIAIEDAQLRVTKSQVAYSTIFLELKSRPGPLQAVVGDGWWSQTYGAAVSLLGGAAQFLAQALIFIFVLCPLWIPIVLLWVRHRRANP
ncbi:MAG: DUF4349 domain-containing protein [Fimbriimonas sp.]